MKILICTFLLVLLSWYLVGLRWRLNFIPYVSILGVTLESNAGVYYLNENERATDIYSLYLDETLLKSLMYYYWPVDFPQIGIKWTEEDNDYYLQIYWYGFDRDDDNLLKRGKFPGWFRLIYFPWFYDGDLLLTGDEYNKEKYKKRKEMERELFIVKSALILHDEIKGHELKFVKELKKNPGVERDINRIYGAVTGTFKEVYGKGLNKEDITSYLEAIKTMDHPQIFIGQH